MANNRNPPIHHYRYLDAEYAKPVLLLILKRGDLPDLTTKRLRDNLLNSIDSPQDRRDINDEINQQYGIMINQPAPNSDPEDNSNPPAARRGGQHGEDDEHQSNNDSKAPHRERQAGLVTKNTRPGIISLPFNSQGLPLFYQERLKLANAAD